MKKCDFLMAIVVNNCNPNGDPLNEGRPRTNLRGHGEISAECIKRKIRNRLQDLGNPIFVQSEDRCVDGCASLHDRAVSVDELKKALKDKDVTAAATIACSKWTDVRLFGQLFAFSGGTSIGIRGAVSVCHSTTIAPVSIKDIQITKSCNGETTKSGGKSSDTMGFKYIVEHGVYIVKGSVNPFLAEKNGVTEADINALKKALISLFENDESSARPSGSMDVQHAFWFEQVGEEYFSTAKIHDLISFNVDGSYVVNEIPTSVKMEILV